MQTDLADAPADVIERARELRNLLQIIGGTTNLLENIWAGRDDSGKYLAMLRTSVDRAAQLTIDIVESAGGATDSFVAESTRPEIDRAYEPASREMHRVLVVDDEPMTRAVFEQLLAAENYEVITAASGCEALDLLRREPDACDLVVLDFTMPFMSGDEVFRRLRASCPHLPVVLATGFIHHGALDTMVKEGLTAFINKPVAPDELIAVVGRILREKHEPSALGGIAAAR